MQNRLFLLVALLWGLLTPISGQSFFTRQQVQDDIQALYTAFQEGHPSIFRYHSKASLDSLAAHIVQHLPAQVSLEKAILCERQFVSAFGCIHTQCLTEIKQDSIFAFGVRILDRRLFVLNDSDKLQEGDEILRINGQSADSIAGVLQSLFSADGYNQTFPERLAGLYFDHYGIPFFEWKSPLLFAVKSPDGTTHEEQVFLQQKETKSQKEKKAASTATPSAPVLQPLLKHKDGYLHRDTLAKEALYFKLHSFSHAKPRWMRKVARVIEKEQPKHLILDLRNNLGGNIHTAFALIDHLTEGPMQVELERRRSKVQRHFDLKSRLFWYLGKAKFDFVPRYHRNRKPSDPSINTYAIRKKDRFRSAFKGSIIILVNPLTASSGSFAAAYLQHYAHATVIGVETGGGGMSNNGLWYPKIKAPHTGAKFNFPLLWLDYDLGTRIDQGKGVVPALVMPYDIADILNKKDPVLEKARELCKK